MIIRPIKLEDKKAYDAVVNHPLQTYEWGEFREKTGVKVIRRGVYEGNKIVTGFTLTIHKIPRTPWTVGYLPKGEYPTDAVIGELKKIGKEEKCIFIQLEPNIQIENGKMKNEKLTFKSQLSTFNLKPAARPLFTKYTFVLDLTPSEEELLKAMHPKTRYNIKVAKRHGVEIIEDNSRTGFESYWQLTEETTKRQGFYAHNKLYHSLQWDILNVAKNGKDNALTSHLFLATYKEKVLSAWLLFIFKDKLYYPYGASSSLHREVMANNLIMWEAIRFGKKKRLKQFDMWGALGPNPDPKDPWYGFHSFKEKYSPTHVEFIGSYDLVINPLLYKSFKAANYARWMLLKLKK